MIFETLPDEIVLHIAEYLRCKDVDAFRLVCQRFAGLYTPQQAVFRRFPLGARGAFEERNLRAARYCCLHRQPKFTCEEITNDAMHGDNADTAFRRFCIWWLQQFDHIQYTSLFVNFYAAYDRLKVVQQMMKPLSAPQHKKLRHEAIKSALDVTEMAPWLLVHPWLQKQQEMH